MVSKTIPSRIIFQDKTLNSSVEASSASNEFISTSISSTNSSDNHTSSASNSNGQVDSKKLKSSDNDTIEIKLCDEYEETSGFKIIPAIGPLQTEFQSRYLVIRSSTNPKKVSKGDVLKANRKDYSITKTPYRIGASRDFC